MRRRPALVFSAGAVAPAPALLIRPSSRPKRAMTASMSRSRSPASVTSQAIASDLRAAALAARRAARPAAPRARARRLRGPGPGPSARRARCSHRSRRRRDPQDRSCGIRAHSSDFGSILAPRDPGDPRKGASRRRFGRERVSGAVRPATVHPTSTPEPNRATATDRPMAAPPRLRAASARRSSRSQRSSSAATATSTPSGRTWPRRSASGRPRCTTTSSPSCTASTRSWPRRWRTSCDEVRADHGASTTISPTRSSPSCEAIFDLNEHEVLRNRLLVSEQVLVGVHRTSAREEEARQLARARTRDLEFAWATFLDARDGAGRDPGGRPAAADARDPRALQQRLPLVPAARRPGAGRCRELLRPALRSRSPACRWTRRTVAQPRR